ncbi:MAG: hypothetical protein AAFN93_15900 [Bacteroidota bacterium]
MQPGLFYHIYTHANGFENIFREEKNYAYFLKRYKYYTSAIVDTYSYCLLPNHFHLLVKVKNEKELLTHFKLGQDQHQKQEQDQAYFENLSGLITQQYSNLFNSYAKAFNKEYKRRGSLFVRPFQRKEIDSDAYLSKVIHYIHANPVHHGFVKSINKWKWSSYLPLLSDKPTLLKRNEVFQWFGGIEEFITFHQQPIDLKISKYLDDQT